MRQQEVKGGDNDKEEEESRIPNPESRCSRDTSLCSSRIVPLGIYFTCHFVLGTSHQTLGMELNSMKMRNDPEVSGQRSQLNEFL